MGAADQVAEFLGAVVHDVTWLDLATPRDQFVGREPYPQIDNANQPLLIRDPRAAELPHADENKSPLRFLDRGWLLHIDPFPEAGNTTPIDSRSLFTLG